MSIRRIRNSGAARDSISSLVLRACSLVLGSVLSVVLARNLGSEGYGIYSYALALVMLLGIPTQAGLPILVMRETAAGMAVARPDLVKGTWVWASRFVAVMSLIILVSGGVILTVFVDGLTDIQTLTIVWALILLPLVALGHLRGAALRGMGHIAKGLLPEFLIRPAFLLILVVGYALIQEGLSPHIAMAMHVAASGIAFLVGAFLIWRLVPNEVRRSKAEYETRRWFRSVVPLSLIAGMMSITAFTDLVMLGWFQSVDQVGIYRVGAQVAMVAAFPLQAVGMALAPRFAGNYASDDIAGLQPLVTRAARAVASLNLFAIVALVTFGRPLLVTLFGGEYEASYLPMLILLGGQFVNSALGPTGYLTNMTGHESVEAKVISVAAVVNIGLNLLLIPSWGTAGAAVASAVSLVVWRGWLWVFLRKRLGIDSSAFSFVARQR